MRLATRKAMAAILACALVFNLLTLINPRMERAGAEPASLWVKQSSQSLTSIAYGNGIYVGLVPAANGDNTKIMKSKDLVNWEEQIIENHTKPFGTVKFLNGQFVIATIYSTGGMTGATFLYSSDGENWTGVTLDEVAQFNLSSIAYGGGKYVASTSNRTVSSADGISWSSEVRQPSLTIKDVQYINGHFVTVGFTVEIGMLGKQTIRTSANGMTWSNSTIGNRLPTVAAALESIASNGDTIITGGLYEAHRFSASNLNQPDLQAQKINGFDYNYFIKKMLYTQMDGGLFIVVGLNGNIRTSTDTFNWTDESIAGVDTAFLDAIEVGNSVVAVGSIGVYKRYGQAIDSELTPSTGSFDKNISNQAVVTTTIKLNWNTLSAIKNGGQALVPGTDYTISAAGDVVSINKEYLATQPVGTTTLTFEFSGGANQTLTIEVSDTTPQNSVISPTTANFDKKESAQSDVTAMLTLNGNSLFNIYEDSYKLRVERDYTISETGDEVVLKKSYLATLPVGTASLTFKFTGGADQTMAVTVSDTTPQNSGLNPTQASFDKKTSAQSDVTTTLTLNGNTLTAITNGSQELELDTDYTVSGNAVTIKKEYLAEQPIGTAILMFQFSAGADVAMAINISDTTPQNSAVSPTTVSFNKKESAQSDVTATLTLNGNSLFNIYENSYKLRVERDYTISETGDEVVLKKAYLATLPVGTATLTFKFTGGADQTMAVTVSDTTPLNSGLNPTQATFDKKTSVQSDITTTLTLNGNTFRAITNGSQELELGTDYTVSGNSVTIKKQYLAQQSVGTAILMFEFNAGADVAMSIIISDTTPNNSAVSPTTASFDKKASAQSDVTATLTLNGNELFNIYENNYKLQLNTDYTISESGDEVVLKKEYLATLPVGTAILTFKFTGGADQTMAVTVSDTTPNNSTISPSTGSFDKETSAQSDVTTTLTLNDNTLNDIVYSGQTLELDSDYTVSGSTVTIKKEYLATLPVGTAILTFQFSAGADQALTITVSDSTPNNSTISPSTASFDKKASAQADVSTTLTLNGNELIGITHGGQELELDTDYIVTGNTVTIKKAYLAAQPIGIATLVFQFSAGSDHALTITISDSTPSNSEISPSTARFDKKSSAQADVAITLTLNGNTLSGISQGGQALTLDMDYTMAGNIVTIKKAYLAKQSVGSKALTFQFSAGSDQTLTVTIVNTTPSTPPSGGGNEPEQPEPNKAADIYVNGQVVSAGTVKESKRNDQNVTTIIVDEAKLSERLSGEGHSPVITILMSSKSDIAVGQLTGKMVKDMENKDATLELKTDKASYFLPASQIDIDGIQRQLGGSVSLQDVVIHIEMAEPVQAMTNVVHSAAQQGEFTIVAAPVDFTVNASYQNRVVEVTQFSAYVQRQIALPEGVERSGITTGIVVEPDGSVRHVPTKVIAVDGRYYAQINSLTNSTYAVVWHPVEFADVASHWAKKAINDMGSRMIVDGKGNDNFKPNEEMTRAEFATILVRGLGLKLVENNAPFADVKASDWYNRAIATAYEYQLISGFEDGTFRPNDKVTRQQAMIMIAKAMKLTQLNEKLPVQAAEDVLQAFGLANMSGWAKQSIADCIQAGIIVGKNGSELALQASITRAEVAVMIQRLLENSELI
ncbi:X2-like carbohydrate binding domain-containing protein [Paenibacillus paeoniae]|uniref:X2-like carbohydrate binding domain-containing protein n=1 Tax=Paenibacillus paeoniae TaxID=2292705 RepID=UPI0014021278|nr:X2-like carbohydrate binding domain-containing protein [Paenibacillus paeoniae]